jgi:hypothetical protein
MRTIVLVFSFNVSGFISGCQKNNARNNDMSIEQKSRAALGHGPEVAAQPLSPIRPKGPAVARTQRSRMMIRERVLTISTLLGLMALPSVALAAPGITDKSYWPHEVAPSSQSRRQTEPGWYRARAMQQGAPPVQIVREGNSSRQGCRYLGGPKSPLTC